MNSNFRANWEESKKTYIPDADDEMGELGPFFAVFLSTEFLAAADEAAAAAGRFKPFLKTVDGLPTLPIFESSRVRREPLPGGVTPVPMRGDHILAGLPRSRTHQVMLSLDDGTSMPLPAEMVAMMQLLVEMTWEANPSRKATGSKFVSAPAAAVKDAALLKECLCRNFEVAAAFLPEQPPGRPARLVVRMHKGREKAFEFVRRDLARLIEEASLQLEVALEDPATPQTGRPFYAS